MNPVDGIDISFSTAPADWAVQRWNEGNRIFVQCLQTGGKANDDAVRTVAPKNLRTFREAEYICGGYANANPGTPGWLTGAEVVARSKVNAGAEWPNVGFVVVDFEIADTPWSRVFELVRLFRAEGKDCRIVYTGKYVIDAIGQPDPAEFASYGLSLWRTGQPGSGPFLPWTTEPVGYQMGETTLGGVTYDYNKFDLDFFAAQPQTEGDEMDKIVKFPGQPETFYYISGGQRRYLGNLADPNDGGSVAAAALVKLGAQIVDAAAVGGDAAVFAIPSAEEKATHAVKQALKQGTDSASDVWS